MNGVPFPEDFRRYVCALKAVYSASEAVPVIALQTGVAVTRNSVIGIWHRGAKQGWCERSVRTATGAAKKARLKPGLAPHSATLPKQIEVAPVPEVRRSVAPRAPVKVPEPEPAPAGDPVDVLGLAFGSCHYIVGEDAQRGALYCGAPADRRAPKPVWCSCHARKVFSVWPPVPRHEPKPARKLPAAVTGFLRYRRAARVEAVQ